MVNLQDVSPNRERENMLKKKELFSELDECKKQIADLRNNLNEIDKQKENWFRKKEGYGNEIRELIRKIKENKEKRDNLTKQVKDDKEIRKKFNEDVKNKISAIKTLKKLKEELIKKYHVKESPSKIKEVIERLEFKIETEVMSFNKEKELMKRIKDFKKKLEFSEEISNVVNKIAKLSANIDDTDKRVEETHNKIQNRARESQKKHEGIIKFSKEIDELKEKEKNAFERFIEFKKKFNEVNDKLKEKLLEMSKIKEEVDKYKLNIKRKKEEREEMLLKSKEEIVQEKIKKGGKLTTEDLLVFQKLSEKKADV